MRWFRDFKLSVACHPTVGRQCCSLRMIQSLIIAHLFSTPQNQPTTANLNPRSCFDNTRPKNRRAGAGADPGAMLGRFVNTLLATVSRTVFAMSVVVDLYRKYFPSSHRPSLLPLPFDF